MLFMIEWRRLIFFIFTLGLLLTGVSPELAAGAASQRMVLVIIDRVTLSELVEAGPNITNIINRGAIGLMNTKTAGSATPANTYLTIGSGAVALVEGSTRGWGFNTGEIVPPGSDPAGLVYQRLTGLKPPAPGVVHLGIAPAQRSNLNGKVTAVPGNLGELLHGHGLKTAVLGNADLDQELHREVVTIAMDKSGRVDYGNVSAALTKDGGFFFGQQTDYEALLQSFDQVVAEANFIVIELGDTSRVDQSRDLALDRVGERDLRLVLKENDKFLGQLAKRLNWQEDRLFIITPTPGRKALKNKELLTPLVIAGSGIEPGFLTSATTRRQGIVANTDIAASTLDFYGISSPQTFTGRPLKTIRATNSISELQLLNRRLVTTYLARPVLVKGYVFLQLAAIILALLSYFLKHSWTPLLKPFLIGLTVVPLVLLLAGGYPQFNVPVYAFEVILLTVIMVAVVVKVAGRRDLDPFILVCWGTVAVIMADMITGAYLLKNSTLSYDPLAGARYYGIGNEYEGIIIGAAIIGVAALLDRFPNHKRLLMALSIGSFGLITFIMGAPQYGCDVGGTIAALAAFTVTILLLAGIRLDRRTILTIVVGTGLVLGAFMVFDASRSPEQQSHIGRTVNLLLDRGSPEAVKIISRKLNMNLKLIRYTIWSRVFLVSLLALAILFYRPVGVIQRIRRHYPYLTHGFAGVLVGSFIGLVVNDSGIVTAATMLIYAVATLVYLVILDHFNKQS